MKDEKEKSGIIVVAMLICIVFVIALFGREEDTPKCMRGICDNERAAGSNYCYVHKSYSNSGAGLSSNSGRSGSSGSSTSKSSTNSGSTNSSQKNSSNSSASKKSSSSSSWPTYSSYDEGYDSVYEDDDYDWDRYQNDSDYANGVEDALDDLYWYGW